MFTATYSSCLTASKIDLAEKMCHLTRFRQSRAFRWLGIKLWREPRLRSLVVLLLLLRNTVLEIGSGNKSRTSIDTQLLVTFLKHSGSWLVNFWNVNVDSWSCNGILRKEFWSYRKIILTCRLAPNKLTLNEAQRKTDTFLLVERFKISLVLCLTKDHKLLRNARQNFWCRLNSESINNLKVVIVFLVGIQNSLGSFSDVWVVSALNLTG